MIFNPSNPNHSVNLESCLRKATTQEAEAPADLQAAVAGTGDTKAN